MASGKTSVSKIGIWVILGLLILGLAGFGANSVSGNLRTIGFAGDQPISVQSYVSELQRQVSQIQAQTGRAFRMDEIRAAGIDQQVLQRLITVASLDQEAADLGVSVGDSIVQRELLQIPTFQGLDGQFSRDMYRLSLDRVGLSEGEFESDLRGETTRGIMQSAVIGGTAMPDVMTDTLIRFVAARRNISWATLTELDLETPVAQPSDSDLQSYYDDNQDAFMLPETKNIRYVRLTPAELLDDVDIEDDAIRTLFDDRRDEFDLPERRLIERLVFSNEEAASSALAQIEVNGTTFDALVADRGLSLSDVDLGEITREDMGDQADAIFAAEQDAVVGPLPTSLGPALFRINGVLTARSIEFDTVRDQLRDELAGAAARRQLERMAEDVDNLLAAGAALDEVAADTDLTLGTIGWHPGSEDPIAAYSAFSQAAATVTAEDFAEVIYLRDGGIAALELIDVQPPRPEPFAEARDAVSAAWRTEAVQTALATQLEPALEALRSGASFEDHGLTATAETDLTRTAFVEALPAGAMSDVFDMAAKDVVLVPNGSAQVVVRLDAILPPDDTEEVTGIRGQLAAGLNQSLAQALFQAYVRDVQLRIRPQIDQRALAAVQSHMAY